jgi:peptidyl-tRNA hydrolase
VLTESYILKEPSTRNLRCLALNPSPLHHYIIVRNDLPLGILAAQIAHASGESILSRVPPGTYAIVLHVSNEAALTEISSKLTHNCVSHVVVHESAGSYKGQAMAIGIAPAAKNVLKKHLSSLPLLRKLKPMAE